MIMVEILVPAFDKEYDFQLDGNALVHILIEEITEMICHKEQSRLVGEESELMLFHMDTGRILPGDSTLSSLGVCTGSRLMLV